MLTTFCKKAAIEFFYVSFFYYISTVIKAIQQMNKILTFPFRHPLGDCTNNGLTSVGDSFNLYFDVEDVDNVPDDSLILIKRELWGKPAWYAKPASLVKSGAHSMMGGNFVYTSDSRFPGDAPIPVHDRVEA